MPKHHSTTVRKTLKERFDERIMMEPNTGCWLWTAAASPLGYGQLWNPSIQKVCLAHRIAWELYVGPIPDGLELCHICDTPECCSPHHHFLGTHKENYQDAAKKHRLHPGKPDNRGENNGQAKLTAEQVRAIRKDTRPIYIIMAAHSIDRRTVYGIKHFTTWKHI